MFVLTQNGTEQNRCIDSKYTQTANLMRKCLTFKSLFSVTCNNLLNTFIEYSLNKIKNEIDRKPKCKIPIVSLSVG